MGRSVQHRNLLLQLMDLLMHLYLLLLKPDRLHHLFFEFLFERAHNLLLMIFISDKGTETFLNTSSSHISVSDLALCLRIYFLVALNIMIDPGVYMIRLIIGF